MVRRRQFPRFLPVPRQDDLYWLAAHLKRVRGRVSIERIAERSGIGIGKIKDLEAGKFHLTVGELRHIVGRGYGCSFVALLAECYREIPSLDRLERPFLRHFFYRLRLQPPNETEAPTPLLAGGDPGSFIWAIPLRALENKVGTLGQGYLVPEFIELAPFRKRNRKGRIEGGSHEGEEVIFVVHGRVEVFVKSTSGTFSALRLNAGECIHFRSTQAHYIENVEKDISALLFVVRYPGFYALNR